jgi:hypothetical protein
MGKETCHILGGSMKRISDTISYIVVNGKPNNTVILGMAYD